MKKINLTSKQRDMLWGDTGPYSEANLKIQTRILDDSVSRVFVVVDVNINPLTFKIIKQCRKEFKDDEITQQLIDSARYMGKKYGYVACAYSREYINEDIIKEAKIHLVYAEDTLIKMHKFVIELLEL